MRSARRVGRSWRPTRCATPPSLERIAEVALLISLFAVGLKLGVPLRDKRWYLPLRLAFPSMALTVLFVAAIGMFLLGLPAGAALLLAAILAPTDPVLASDVQVEDSSDRDRLRFSLTAEGGLNDGAAFPFVHARPRDARALRFRQRRLALAGGRRAVGASPAAWRSAARWGR